METHARSIEILNGYRNVAIPIYAAIYLALSAGPALPDGTVNETTAVGYARQLIPLDNPPSLVGGVIDLVSSDTVVFGPFDNGGPALTHFFFIDVVSGAGNIIECDEITLGGVPTPITPGIDDTIVFSAGSISFSRRPV